MLDTHTRSYIQPVFNKSAVFLASRGVSPNTLTVIALALGLRCFLQPEQTYLLKPLYIG